MDNFRVNVYIETTVRGPRRGAAAGMWLVEYILPRSGRAEKREGILYREDTTWNAITLELINEAFSILTKPCLIRVNTECPHVLSVMRNGTLPVWEKNGWINAKGEPVKNKEAWQRACFWMRPHAVTVDDGWHGHKEEMRSKIKEEMERMRTAG